jgi:hypothetical protein
MTYLTPAELRAKADAMDQETAYARKGKVLISQYTGMACIHQGDASYERAVADYREATEAEIQALCTIPEFAAYLKKVRGEA